jgi:MFS family permease
MPQELTNAEKVRKLPWALAGDFFNVIYFTIAFAGSTFVLFLSTIGLDTQRIGVLLSIIPLCGLVAPVVAPLVARIGVRRVFLTLFSLRGFVLATLVLAPWVVQNHGSDSGLLFVAAVLILFALCRSIGENGLVVWSQEFIPQTIRGKYQAMQMIVMMTTGALSVFAVGWVLGDSPTVLKFQIIFGVVFVLGLFCPLLYSRVGGGEPVRGSTTLPSLSEMLVPLKDKRFMRLIGGNAICALGWMSMASFLPLFYRDHLGLPASQIVRVDAAFMIGSLLTCYLWGWAVDRYGSKPVMLLSLSLHVMFPLSLLLIPRNSPMTFVSMATSAFTLGLICQGWGIGYGRYLFVNIIPADKRSSYTALHTAWLGLFMGIAPLMAGQLLELTKKFSGQFGPVHIDPYTPFFVACVLTVSTCVWILSRLPGGGSMNAARFAMMFVQGNPIAALQAVAAFSLAGDEGKRLTTIERLGQSRSPLSVEELIEALEDPSFNIRHEAIVSIARTRQDARLTEAMVRNLRDGAPDLQTTVAWALGRMGDASAAPALREALESTYPLLRARAARALAMLDDADSVPRLAVLFAQETDPAIRVAYASSLAGLGHHPSTPALLDMLREQSHPGIRRELAMAVATLLGPQEQALRLWRRMQQQPGDTLGGVMIGLRRRLTSHQVNATGSGMLGHAIDQCIRDLGMDRLDAGAEHLITICAGVKHEAFTPTARLVLPEVTRMLRLHKAERPEYVLLAVHALHIGMLPEYMSAGTSPLPGPLAAIIGD